MDVYFGQREIVLHLRDISNPGQGLSRKYINLTEEYLYIPGQGVLCSPFSMSNGQWYSFTDDSCLMKNFDMAIAGDPNATIRNVRKAERTEEQIRVIVESGRAGEEIRRAVLISLGLEFIIEEEGKNM